MAWRELLAILAVFALRTGLGIESQFVHDQDPQSVCYQYHRVNGTKRASYLETYYEPDWNNYGRTLATRINFRIETVTKWSVIEVCCDGYEPRELAENAEECVPVCPGGCENGTCHRPNSCTCDDGYNVTLNEKTGYSECRPHCDSGCVGGECVRPNDCACESGYLSAHNGSSCEPDCADDGNGGLSKCGNNAVCILPNTCQCQDGYEPVPRSYYSEQTDYSWNDGRNKAEFQPSDGITCRPICEPKCSGNAKCLGPNDCQCDEGYQSVGWYFASNCVPKCEQTCFNGFCASPNECRCNVGYEPHEFLRTNLCEATCREPCVNGKCAHPDLCECLEGYEKLVVRTGNTSGLSPNICVPVCPGDCSNGSCIAPGRCHCDPGYVAANFVPEETTESTEDPDGHWTGKSWQTCRPTCEPSCDERSFCSAPNRCRLRLFDSNSSSSSEYSINRARIVGSSAACENGGVFRDQNGGCLCEYDRNCTENVLCAVVILDDVASADKFGFLESIVFWDDTSTGYNESHEARNFREPSKCTEECRISILSKKNPDLPRHVKSCFRPELYNATIAILSDKLEDPSSSIANDNETLFCFVDASYPCQGSTELGVAEWRVREIVGGTIGSILLIAIFVALGISIYLTRRKLCNIRWFKGSFHAENAMERSEATDSPFHADENAHL